MKIIKTTISVLVSLVLAFVVFSAVHSIVTAEPSETVYSASSCIVSAR